MSQTVLTLQHIEKSYQDGTEKRTILSDINLEVQAGEFVAIVGPSGCGKSTLLNIAGLMLSADKGTILLDGEDVSHLSKKKWSQLRHDKIGFIFQNHQLLPYLTASEQLTTLLGTKEATMTELFKELDLTAVANAYPGKLSGGERQRVAIARAFASDASVILADEPTASLDSTRGHRVVEMIRTQAHKRGKGAIMVTHDERVLDLVDRIYRMEDGQLTLVQ